MSLAFALAFAVVVSAALAALLVHADRLQAACLTIGTHKFEQKYYGMTATSETKLCCG